jgi:hypothetical protein
MHIQLRLPERHHVSSFSAILVRGEIRNELDGFTSHLTTARQRRNSRSRHRPVAVTEGSVT